jgi:hypothetical protein
VSRYYVERDRFGITIRDSHDKVRRVVGKGEEPRYDDRSIAAHIKNGHIASILCDALNDRYEHTLEAVSSPATTTTKEVE